MKIKHVSVIVLVLISFGFGLSAKLQKKVNKVIKSTFEIESFSLHEFKIPEEVTADLPSSFSEDNFFEIKSTDEVLGYAYVAKAPSKTAEFDYLVILDKELIVVKTKVLIYREEYGGEIGSKRWLKQFIGKTKEDKFIYGDNIDAISGATISVRSMTRAMNNLMASLKILNEKNIL